MSFEVFLQGFSRCEAATGDGQAALNVLEPLVAKREAGCWVLESAEPEVHAAVYGVDRADRGLMFSRPSGADIMDVIYEVARRAGFAIMPVGCGTLIISNSMRRELPGSIPKPIVLIESGADLDRVISSF